MAYRDGRAGIQQQHCGRLAHDVAAPNHHRFLPCNWNLAALQDLHDTRRGARNQPWPLRGQESYVHRMKAIDIFGGVDHHQYFLRVDLRRQGGLYQEAVDLVAAIQASDQLQQFFGRNCFRRRVLLAVKPDFGAALHFAANINFRRSILADQDHSQPGAHSGRSHRLHCRRDLSSNFTGDFIAVQNSCRHQSSLTFATFDSANSRTRSSPACSSAWNCSFWESPASAGTMIRRLTRIKARENGLGIIDRSQVFRIQAFCTAIWNATMGAPVARASSTGPGLATNRGPRGRSMVKATGQPCSSSRLMPSRARTAPRLLDP